MGQLRDLSPGGRGFDYMLLFYADCHSFWVHKLGQNVCRQICKASVYAWQHTQCPTASSDPGWPCHNSVETWSNEHRQEGRACVRCSSDVLPGFSLEPGMEEQATPYNCYQTKVELILGVSRRKRITPMSLCKPQPKQTVSLV